jgi:hypothetical protein
MTTHAATIDEPGCGLEPGTREISNKRTKIVLVSRETGTLWFAGWLFTIGFAQLGFWKGVLALIAWPYFLGVLAAG